MGMERIYHITTRSAWEVAQAAGAYAADTLPTEGFIHCSTQTQVEGTLNRYFQGRDDLVLLTIDPSRLTSSLRYEPAHGELYPHVYGPICCDAIVARHSLTPSFDGLFSLDRSMTAL